MRIIASAVRVVALVATAPLALSAGVGRHRTLSQWLAPLSI